MRWRAEPEATEGKAKEGLDMDSELTDWGEWELAGECLSGA